MTAGTIAVAIACQLPLVAGQVFLKHGVVTSADPAQTHSQLPTPSPITHPKSARHPFAFLIAGIACLTLWFFLWLGLLQQQELSKMFPFEGLNPALMVLAAWLFLREKIPAAAWMGVALICLGIALVCGS